MAASDTAKLLASLTLKDGFTGPLKKMDQGLSRFDAHLKSTESRSLRAGKQIGTGIKNGAAIAAVGIGLLATQVAVGLNQLVQLEGLNAQTEAGLKSTRNASGQTAESIREMSEAFENLNAVIDDKVIQSGANVLLTFTRIGKDAFQPALAAALDLSVAMGQDLQTSIVQVGKALNDPAKGFTALRRVGIQFTKDQETQIKTLQESGDLLGAQRIILQELGTEFGGRFKAQGESAEGTIAGIGDAVEDLQKSLATSLFPTVKRLLPQFRQALTSPEFTRAVSDLGDRIGALFSPGNIAEGTRLLTGLFNTAKSVAPAIQRAAEVTGEVVKSAVGLFKSLPPEIQSLAIAGLAVNKLTGGLVTNLAGGLISAVISSFKGLMNVNAAVVNVNGAVGGGGLPNVLPAAGGALGITAAAVAALIAAPVVIAGVGLLVTKLSDPQGIRALEGKAATARARGIPDENNKPLQELKQLNAVEDRTYDSIEKLRGAITTDTLSVNVQNAAAIGQSARQVISADRAARGLTGPFKRSTSINPRLKFLAGNASGAKDVAVVEGLARGFEKGNSPAFRSTAALKDAIKAVSRDIKTLPPEFTGPLTDSLNRLKTELSRRQREAKEAADRTARAAREAGRTTAAAIRDKEFSPKISVPVTVNQFYNGRLVDAASKRFSSTIVGSRGTVAVSG